MKISLRHLSYFEAFCEVGHFGQAADNKHVTQPALSTKIRELEDILGTPLVDRSSRPFQPTPFGREVLERTREILSGVSALEASARYRRGLEGPFRLGAIPTIAPFLLPRALQVARKKLPDLELQILEATTDVLMEELECGRIDACILATPVPGQTFAQHFLFSDRFVLGLNVEQAERLGFCDRHIVLDNMPPVRLLLLSDGHCLREQTRDLCKFASQQSLNQIGSSSLQTVMGLSASGYGVTLLPELSLDETVFDGSLAALRLAEPEPDREISLVTKSYLREAMDVQPLANILSETGKARVSRLRATLERMHHT
ncbi:hydrogen peroxide-inducible genes activator [Loktanella sp. Alg231-35]|uniref:hydrogen peroxide-inducible genes activator n=1 Tax=Loktanella sp. Alg231-35 TaxID=1922220 RepID=UPI000D54E6D1|nr:hydrogen peroxide-inducible genes activator [Loktanella sp. Alg231-35]